MRKTIPPLGYFRIALRLAAMVAALVPALVLHGLWRLLRLPSPWPRHLLGAIGWIAGARRRTFGTPLRRDVFFTANHLSWLDILVLAGATGTAFIAKAELRGVPLIGWLCTLNRTIFVARGERMAVADQIAEIRAAIERGWPVAIFPEGTTGDGRTLLPFKAALLAVLDPPPPGVRVQPVRIDYGAATDELAWQDETGIAYSLRVLARPGSFPANLRFAEPFDPAGVGDRKAIAAEARRRVEGDGYGPLSLSLTETELAARRPVWAALSDLFLDTDVALARDHGARMLAASPYRIDQIEQILTDEVTPVCRWNLYSVAGEWAGFDEAWLEAAILSLRQRTRPKRPMRMMWPEWLALREATEQLRAAPLVPAAASD